MTNETEQTKSDPDGTTLEEIYGELFSFTKTSNPDGLTSFLRLAAIDDRLKARHVVDKETGKPKIVITLNSYSMMGEMAQPIGEFFAECPTDLRDPDENDGFSVEVFGEDDL